MRIRTNSGLLGVFAGLCLCPPDAFSDVPKRCDQVIIHAIKKVNGGVYQQFGQGIPFGKNSDTASSPYLLTNEHVIGQGDELLAICGDNEFKVKLMGSSPSADIAVLSVSADDQSKLISQFSLAPSKADAPKITDILVSPEIRYIPPGVAQSTQSLKGALGFHFVSNSSFPLTGTYLGLGIMSIGSRPGMSGGAVFDGGSKPEFAGMITRTAFNEALSLAIPRGALTSLIPALLRGIDPLGPNGGGVHYLTSELQPNSNSGLDRVYLLHAKTADGNELTLRDACSSQSFGQTSQWGQTGGGDYGRPGGGDYGRPRGDSSTKASSFVVNKDVKVKANPLEIKSIDVTIFRPTKSPCEKDGVLFPDGRRLVGVINDDQYQPLLSKAVTAIHSVDNLDPIFRRKRMESLAFIEKNGVFAGEADFKMDSLCDQGHLLGEKILTFAHGNIFCYDSGSGSELDRLVYFSRELKKISNVALAPEKSFGSLSCDPVNHLLALKSDPDEDHPESINLKIGANQISGTLQIGTCKVEINQAKELWSATIKDSKLEAELSIQLDPVILLRITPTRMNPSCLQEWRKKAPTARGQIAEFSWHIGF